MGYNKKHRYIDGKGYIVPQQSDTRQKLPVPYDAYKAHEKWGDVKCEISDGFHTDAKKTKEKLCDIFENLFIFLVEECYFSFIKSYWLMRNDITEASEQWEKRKLNRSVTDTEFAFYAWKKDLLDSLHISAENVEKKCIEVEDRICHSVYNQETPNLKVMGIYAIKELRTNTICYIGKTKTTIQSRWTTHRRKLRKGKHGNWKLQQIWNSCGEKNIAIELLEEVTDVSDLQKKEKYWVAQSYIYKNKTKIKYNLCNISNPMNDYNYWAK